MEIDDLQFASPDLAEQYGLALLECGDIVGGKSALQLAWCDEVWLLHAHKLAVDGRDPEARAILEQIRRARRGLPSV